jgi:HEAT repeat protein
MAHRGFDEHMSALDALKGQPVDDAAIEFIRKSLASRSNILVSKAARLAEDNNLAALVPDVIASFIRFFADAEKTDPQCWAKNALGRALSKLECRDTDVFLRGLRHHQMEPVWGGRSDTAGTLRANCALALVACESIPNEDLLLLLIDLLVDPDKRVRSEVVRAIAQIGSLALPVLRLRALIPGEDPEVLSALFCALLNLDRADGISFVSRFLASADDSAAEAAFALAETHSQPALDALLDLHRNQASGPADKRGDPRFDPWFAGILLSSIALTRLPQAIDYLIALIEHEDREAPLAIESLAKLASNPELRARLVNAVEEVGSPRLTRTLHEHLVQNAP